MMPMSAGLHSSALAACLCLVLGLSVLWVFAPSAYPWGGEHHRITEAALDALPEQERHYIAPERTALIQTYCGFPDMNWPCYGEWGGGVGDPAAARFPDTRREWGISYYCQWDPVLRRGKGFSHAPPQSCEAAGVFFLKGAHALRERRLEDGARFLGVMLHYIQDSGAFPHVQPVHRSFHVRGSRAIRLDAYAPKRLGENPDEAAKALAVRVQALVEWTEKRLGPHLEQAGMPLAEAKALCGKQTMPSAVIQAVEKLRAARGADFEAAAEDCANECARACADALYSALAFAQRPYAEAAPAPPNVNLVLNPSFEQDSGDCVPEGWCVGWLDLSDRLGRAEWYRAGTHWEKFVRTASRSVLILWPPKKGLDWRQTWPAAVRVRPGERYRASAWVRDKGATGSTYCALEFYDADYKPLAMAKSASCAGDSDWRELSVEARAPDKARWLRLLLRSEDNQGAVWFDDAAVVRQP